MKHLLLVSHRPLEQAGGPTARWRAFRRYLPDHGWEVEVLCASPGPGTDEFATAWRARLSASARARVMARAGRIASPAFGLVGVRPEALPLSTTWVPRGAAAIRRRLRERGYEAVLATGPPMAALMAARLGVPPDGPAVALELRDLWAGNPAFDAGGPVLPAAERWTVSRAGLLIACTPEAVADLRERHPAARVEEISNGFDPSLLELEHRRDGRPDTALTILHSGTLTCDRPLAPLLRALSVEPYRSRFRLELQGYLAPPILAEVGAAGPNVDVRVLPPAPWPEAVERIASADVALVTQAGKAGDATAIAAKAYEYLALGRPVLCLTDGGATEALLARLGADQFCGRLGDGASIEAALARLLELPRPPPPNRERLAAYDLHRLAARLAALLDSLESSRPGGP